MTTSPMRGHGLVVWTYLVNATLLSVHEIDSAYWHEWSLFGIPGGGGIFSAGLPSPALAEACHREEETLPRGTAADPRIAGGAKRASKGTRWS